MSDLEMVVQGGTADEKGNFIPGEEPQYTPRTFGFVMAKDSIALQMHDFPMRGVQKPFEKADKQNTKPKDDSILTFNFLYYIIQKYKLQDVID